MARLLGQLRCGGCRHVFWPERDQATATFVPCPSCGAPHANTTAEARALPAHAAVPSALDWLRRYWLGGLPSYPYVSVLGGLRAAEVLQLQGFACLVTWNVVGHPQQPLQAAFYFVAAKPPPTPPACPKEPLTVTSWAPGGLHHYRHGKVTLTTAQQELGRIVAFMRGAGATPSLPFEEVEDPTPLERAPEQVQRDVGAERYLESLDVSCGACGAPSRAVELTGAARCPYCGESVALAPDLARTLHAYHARVAAVHRVARAPTLMNLRSEGWSARLRADEVALTCVRCGAPNRHRPGARDEECASCRAALIPSASARALGGGASSGLAEEAHRHRGDLRAARELRETSRLRQQERHLLIFGCVALTGLTVLGGLLTVLRGVPTIAIFAALGWLGLIMAVATTWIGRTRLGRRWRPRLNVLGEQLAGPVAGSPDALAAWAKRWWPDRLAPWWLREGPAYGLIETVIAGFPVAVGAHVQVPLTPFGGSSRAFAMVLLAAALPRDTAYWLARPDAQALVRLLEERGFTVEPRLGGLAARAEPPALARMTREPAALMELAYVAFMLARLAHQLRAENH